MAPNPSRHALPDYGESKIRQSDLERCLKEALRRFVRGAITGVTLYSAVIILKGLLSRKLLQRPDDVIRDIFCTEALRFTVFLGSYPAVYKLAVYLAQKYRKQKDGVIYILAGVLASFTIVIDNADRRKTLAMFLFSRALGAAYNALVSRKYIQPVPHGNSLVFSASTGMVLIGLVIKPKLLPKSYYQTPVSTLLGLFLKYVKSATFLTVMCTTIKTIICLLRLHVHHSPAPLPYYIPFAGGFFGALAGLQFESPRRRGELAMYVASIALDAVFIWGRDAGIFKPLPYGSLLIFVVSMAVITHAYERDKDTLSPLLKGGMTFLCGKPENQKEIKGNWEIPSENSLHKELRNE
ncbi:uncharacterized protein LOC144348227 [Saccoglossus kowalevskii]